jgi:hypothetical protein
MSQQLPTLSEPGASLPQGSSALRSREGLGQARGRTPRSLMHLNSTSSSSSSSRAVPGQAARRGRHQPHQPGVHGSSMQQRQGRQQGRAGRALGPLQSCSPGPHRLQAQVACLGLWALQRSASPRHPRWPQRPTWALDQWQPHLGSSACPPARRAPALLRARARHGSGSAPARPRAALGC